MWKMESRCHTLIRAHLDRSLEKVTPAVELGLSRETFLAQKAVTL